MRFATAAGVTSKSLVQHHGRARCISLVVLWIPINRTAFSYSVVFRRICLKWGISCSIPDSWAVFCRALSLSLVPLSSLSCCLNAKVEAIGEVDKKRDGGVFVILRKMVRGI